MAEAFYFIRPNKMLENFLISLYNIGIMDKNKEMKEKNAKAPVEQSKSSNTAKPKKKKKKLALWKKLTIIASSIVLVICIAFGSFILYFRLNAKDFYQASEKAFEIPGLSSGFVPQGLEFNDMDGDFLVSGYMKDGSASRLYVVQKNSQELKKCVSLLTDENTPYTGHFGGVAKFEDFVYVPHEQSLLVYSYKEIVKPENTDPIPCLGKISLKYSNTDYLKPAFVSVYANTLIVGEFYDGNEHTTLKKHHINTPAGNENHAIALEFNLNAKYKNGIDTRPTKAYSIPDNVQGLCIYDNNETVYLSTSYGCFEFSHVLKHAKPATPIDTEQYSVFLGTPVPVYALDSSTLQKDYKLPPMAEGIVMFDKELYVVNEWASNKYFFGKFVGGKWCYKTDLSSMNGDLPPVEELESVN